MPTALIVIAIIYGACLLGTALVNMGEGAFFFIALIISVIIIDRIVSVLKSWLKNRKEKDEWTKSHR